MVTRATIHYLQAIGGGLTGMFFNVTLFKIRRVFNVDFFQAGFLSSTAFCDDEEEAEPSEKTTLYIAKYHTGALSTCWTPWGTPCPPGKCKPTPSLSTRWCLLCCNNATRSGCHLFRCLLTMQENFMPPAATSVEWWWPASTVMTTP